MMSEIKIKWYDTVCSCPEWAKDLPAHCSGDCTECEYLKENYHFVQGNYKKFDYDESNGTFTFGNRKIQIQDNEMVFHEWIEYLEIDGEEIIAFESEYKRGG